MNNVPQATLTDPATNLDIAKGLITEGIVLAEKSKERRVAKLVWSENPNFNNRRYNIKILIFILQVEEYRSAEQAAKKDRSGVWQYGDITEDDAKEFGTGR